ncbi:MAG: hypothetical protein GQ532_01010 [Methylomarinum sp.]|nr:hypothetical protein [Methylomarinum sp.]
MSDQEIKKTKNHNNEKGVDEKRRSFSKAGIVAPVILSLSSKPVLANHCSVSGMMSGNVSNPHDKICGGCTPGYWKNHPKSWPASYTPGECSASAGNSGHCKVNGNNAGEYTGGTIFSDVFTNCRGLTSDGETMIDLLMAPQTYWTLHAHAVGSFLNATAFSDLFGNTADDVKAWWCDSDLTDEELKDRYAMLNERVCPLGNDDKDYYGNNA